MQKPLRELSRLCLGTGGGQHGTAEICSEAKSGLPLLQVWPSDSPRGEADGQAQAFVFPDTQESVNDSGIDSIQVSPSPCGPICSSSPSTTPQPSRRPSLLHPDHARLHLHHLHHHYATGSKGPSSPDRNSSLDEDPPPGPPSPSSSTTSSLHSMPSSAIASMYSQDRRRSSRYSVFDALDLEYALLRAAARGSVGPYSLSESLHKLTFTQSLAFPALARGLASKQSRLPAARPKQDTESGLNAFAKVVTALVLVLVSVLVFGVVYKFVRT